MSCEYIQLGVCSSHWHLLLCHNESAGLCSVMCIIASSLPMPYEDKLHVFALKQSGTGEQQLNQALALGQISQCAL